MLIDKRKKDIAFFFLVVLGLEISILTYNLFTQNIVCYNLKTKDIANMYENYIDEWKLQSKKSFDEAEAKIFTTPKPPVVVIPMEDPDPAKCICKGTGIITHGDGHKTPCQYHGVNKQLLKDKELKYKQLIIIGE